MLQKRKGNKRKVEQKVSELHIHFKKIATYNFHSGAPKNVDYKTQQKCLVLLLCKGQGAKGKRYSM